MANEVTEIVESLQQSADVISRGQRDFHEPQTQCGLTNAGSAGTPDVHRHVVVIATRRHEQGLPVPIESLVKPEVIDVKLARDRCVTDGQVDVSDAHLARSVRGNGGFGGVVFDERVGV